MVESLHFLITTMGDLSTGAMCVARDELSFKTSDEFTMINVTIVICVISSNDNHKMSRTQLEGDRSFPLIPTYFAHNFLNSSLVRGIW